MTRHIHPKSAKEWRAWLERNHDKETRVGVVKYKRHTKKPTITHQEAMEEAICFGWIDTTVKRLDDDRYVRYFVRRNKNSRWSKATLSYAKRLIKEDRMAPAGRRMFEEGLRKPTIDLGLPKNPPLSRDVRAALQKAGALGFFNSLAPSYKRLYIITVERVKLPETRKRKIDWVVDKCRKQLKPME